MTSTSGRIPPVVTGLLTTTLLWAAATDAGAQQPARPDTAEAPGKRMAATRIADGTIALDGRLDEGVWATVPFRDDFLQRGKDRGFDPRAETRIAVLYDDEALYVGARMEGDPEGGVGPRVGARDDAGNVDRILVSLDTDRDRTTAYTFGVTRGGVRLDYVQSRDTEGWRDESFDPAWAARVASDPAGWTAEMRIPFSQLRSASGDDQVWGLNVRRVDPASFLNVYWVVVPYDEAGWASRFGELHGLSAISGGARAEVVPYAVQQATYLDPAYGGDGAPAMETRVGGDAKVGVGSNMTLDATVNPDFGQVEADPARVNLTAFETFFPEQRSFFLERRELFRTRGPTWFYSRRVGSAPSAAVPQQILEQVESTRILGGARLTGRTSAGSSVGVLAALTDRATIPAAEGGAFEAVPRSGFGVLRLQRDVGEAGSSIGVIGTAVERFGGGEYVEGVLPGRALAGGGDIVLRLGDGAYEVSGFAGGSRVTGTPEAIAGLARSSAHYFQRPDAPHVSLDPGRTALGGWTAGVRAGRVAGLGWRWDTEVSAASPGFEIRDAGAQTRADVIDARVGVSYEVRDGSGALRNRSVGGSLSGGWNFGGVRRQASASAHVSTAWSNRWTSYAEVGMNAPALSDELTRGGPLMATPRSWWTTLQLSRIRTGNSWWTLDGSGFVDAFGGWSGSLDGGLTVQVGRHLGLSVHTGGSTGDASRQYIQRLDGGPDATFGTRYVFSALEQSELFARLRAEIAFAPDAVLTLHAEPFVSSGRAHGLGELEAARSGSLRIYGTDGTSVTRLDDGAWHVVDGGDELHIENFDFWVRSFRGSAVLRWEWRTGSLLHLIWRREQWRLDPRDGPMGPDTLVRSLHDPGMDVLLAKVSVLLGSR